MSAGASRHVSVITAWASAAMVLNGLVAPTWGPVLVPIGARFHLGTLALGTIFAVRGVCGLCGSLVAGTLSDRMRRHRLVAAYGVLLCACFLGVAMAPAWWAVLAGAGGASFSFACATTETNALTALAGGAMRGRQLSITNAIYGIGATVGPLIVGGMLADRLGWRLPFVLWAVGALAVLLPFSRVVARLPEGAPSTRRESAGLQPVWRLLGRRLVVLWAIAFMYNGVAWTIVGWSTVWLVHRFGAGLFLGATTATAFYAFLTLGRFVNAALTGRVSTAHLLGAEGMLTGAGLLLGAAAGSALGAIAAFALTGLAMGGLYPNAQALAVGTAPDRPGAMTASVAIAGAAGTMTVPALTGALGGTAAAMSSLVVWAGVSAVLGLLAVRGHAAAAGGGRAAAT